MRGTNDTRVTAQLITSKLRPRGTSESKSGRGPSTHPLHDRARFPPPALEEPKAVAAAAAAYHVGTHLGAASYSTVGRMPPTKDSSLGSQAVSGTETLLAASNTPKNSPSCIVALL